MTETTQPDPQVVAWMRDYRQRNPLHRTSDAVEAYLDHLSALSPGSALSARHRLAPLVSAWSAAKPPLTRADIPAGQGPASLFLAPDGHGDFDLCFKYADGRIGTADIELGTLSPTLIGAFRDHLAATLPTVTTEETP